ncbi:Retrovirus-related Pol polyprotein from transposon [Sesamum angolense]|uniref:Retrovirus-related Pol polyprotein from transposon n=1 Tax=Sesamum angolense TaxID=2727404 RepID=A0AAE2BLP0_9LAMI|nr:Retrovirus-related Pol polyprotein from transposon [Sesamum angolense]
MMDTSQGYHQIMLATEDHKRVSFITSDGTFCYVAMPFRLKNAGATYQRLVDEIFRPQLSTKMEVYVEDMLVKSKEARNHVEDLEKTFAVLRKYRLELNPKKCAFRVSGGRFLGFMPIPGDTLYLYLSSTSQASSSVLVREEDGDQTPIYYVSKVLNGAEGCYPPIERMALALVTTARKLHPYFLSYPVGVRTNTPLKQVLGRPEASGRLVKWAIELSEYDISYLPRTAIKAQALADFVSEMTGTIQEEVPEESLANTRGRILHRTKEWNKCSNYLSSRGRHRVAIKFDFKASNNKAEYEGLVLSMKMAQDINASHLLAYSDSQLIVK